MAAFKKKILHHHDAVFTAFNYALMESELLSQKAHAKHCTADSGNAASRWAVAGSLAAEQGVGKSWHLSCVSLTNAIWCPVWEQLELG